MTPVPTQRPEPVLSIVTPLRDQSRFLARCLASMRDQPERVAEHIVMDGGSTDGGVEVLRASEGLASWRSERDRGQSHAINEGFRAARGVFGGWLNADDWFLPGALGEVAAFFGSNPETDVLVCRARFVGEDGRMVHAPSPPERIDEPALLRLRSGWFAGHSIAQPEVFFRLELFRAVGGLDEDNHHSMDHHLWLKFIERGARVRQLETVVACQGVHAGQKTADRLAATASIVRSARVWLDRRRSHWPLRADEVSEEIEALERKLARAGRYVGAIDRALCGARDASRRAGGASVLLGPAPEGWEHAIERVIGEAGRDVDAWVVVAEGSERAAVAGVRGLGACRVVGADEIGVCGAGSVRGLVLHRALGAACDPGRVVRDALGVLAPGGTLVVSAEPEASGTHEQYLKRLRTRAVNKITQPDEFVIGPRADATIRPMLDGVESSMPELHPHPLGIEVERVLSHAGVRARIAADHRFGGFDWLPLAPFPSLPKLTPHGPDGGGHDCWRTCAVVVDV